jgi:hypothetical protein
VIFTRGCGTVPPPDCIKYPLWRIFESQPSAQTRRMSGIDNERVTLSRAESPSSGPLIRPSATWAGFRFPFSKRGVGCWTAALGAGSGFQGAQRWQMGSRSHGCGRPGSWGGVCWPQMTVVCWGGPAVTDWKSVPRVEDGLFRDCSAGTGSPQSGSVPAYSACRVPTFRSSNSHECDISIGDGHRRLRSLPGIPGI